VHLSRLSGVVLTRAKLSAGTAAAAALFALGLVSGTLQAAPSRLGEDTTTTTIATTTLHDGSGCTPQGVAVLMRALIRAWNAGNARAVDRLFAPTPAFKWFSMGGPEDRRGKDAEKRSTIRAFVRKRHRRHDRMTLVMVQGNVHFYVRRRADDYHPRNLIEGKGAAICRHPPSRFIAWST
jgi:hypothetical protein